mmetsp:Transcript_128750/g.287821  ORF Transcript_128750/g.287821 Transcript_128750/m.287821 type:complete len:226 (-) Transcript_128750:2993-3670(-)
MTSSAAAFAAKASCACARPAFNCELFARKRARRPERSSCCNSFISASTSPCNSMTEALRQRPPATISLWPSPVLGAALWTPELATVAAAHCWGALATAKPAPPSPAAITGGQGPACAHGVDNAAGTIWTRPDGTLAGVAVVAAMPLYIGRVGDSPRAVPATAMRTWAGEPPERMGRLATAAGEATDAGAAEGAGAKGARADGATGSAGRIVAVRVADDAGRMPLT